MGLKAWLVRHTSNPGEYADCFASSVIELGEHLAVHLIASSGTQTASSHQQYPVAFATHFDMEQAGFTPQFDSLFFDPVEVATHPLFPLACRNSIAFVSLSSEDAAWKLMKAQHSKQFAQHLNCAVARNCAGRFGFEQEPQRAFNRIQATMPLFEPQAALNENAMATTDRLGNLLKSVSSSSDGLTRYAFVVGSATRLLGCTPAYREVLHAIRGSIERAAHDFRW